MLYTQKTVHIFYTLPFIFLTMQNGQQAATEYDALPYKINLIFENDAARLYSIPDKQTMICQSVNEYMTEEEFRNFFEQIAKYVAVYLPTSFVFDKRALKAFHQPSMEWYFTEWKTEMATLYGLRKHRKILPPIKWFELAVKAGRAQLAKKYPDGLFHQFDIQYRDSLLEAINS